MTRILVVEDEESFSEALAYLLGKEGFDVVIADTGTAAVELFDKHGADLVLLDLMLPGLSGTEVCKQLRTRSAVPIIMLTAKDSEIDKVVGLELGADDYLAKPFSPRELLARVKAVLRRGPPKDEQGRERIVIQDLVIDASRHEVEIQGEIKDLTATEFKILYQLASQPGRAFTREQLLNRVVGPGVVVVDRNIDVHIRAVRKKLGVYSSLIQTIRGVGYRLADK